MSAPRRPFFERLFAPLFGLGLVLALVPIWTIEVLPLGDYGAHLEQMDIMARHDEATTVYGDTYVLPDSPLHPNSLSLLAGRLLGPAIGVERVGRLLLTFYVVGFGFGALAVALAFGRPTWLAFFALPLVFNAQLNVGFLNFVVAWPFLLGSVALARVFAERGGWRWGLALAVALAASFFAHVIAFLFAAGLAAALLALFARRWRDLTRLMVLAPALALFGAWAGRLLSHQTTETGRSFASEQGLGLVYLPLSQKLALFQQWGLQFFRDATDNVFVVALVALWLGLVALGVRQGRRRAPAESGPIAAWPRRHSLELLTGCCLVAYFALPSHLAEVDVISERVVVLVLVLATCWPRVDFGERGARALLGALLAVVVIFPLVVRAQFARFDREYVGELRTAIAALPPRARLAYVERDYQNGLTYMGPTHHLAKWFNALENGGLTNDSFAMRPSSPIQFRPGRTPPPLSLWPADEPALLAYDALLVRAMEEPVDLFGREWLRLRWHEGYWWLFAVGGH